MDPGSHFLMSSKLEYEYVEISVCMDQALGKVEDKGLFLPLLLPPKGWAADLAEHCFPWDLSPQLVTQRAIELPPLFLTGDKTFLVDPTVTNHLYIFKTVIPNLAIPSKLVQSFP